MTALSKYARLEATALWRAVPEGQRREVVVVIGDATLVIKDLTDQALTHWSLAAVERANPGETPAIYHPDGDPGETLEIDAEEAEMVEAIETLRRAISKTRPRPGRLRGLGLLLSAAAVGWATVFWLPGALLDHTLRVVPEVKRDQIGAALLSRIERVSGPACGDSAGLAALRLLSQRLRAGDIAVLPQMTRDSLHLPGGTLLLNNAIIEDHEEPDVAAGYIVTESTRRAAQDPLRDLLNVAGLRENFRLLTTGELSDSALDAYAQVLMTRAPDAPRLEDQLARFEALALRSTPYAYAVDITGETTLPLIEGDPMNGRLTEPLMSDADWLRLQNICGD
ncbi:MAG: hypothetical protein AAF744_04675 [Pseudomonadota bacterium]